LSWSGAQALEEPGRLEDRRVLDRRRHEVVCAVRPSEPGAEERRVVRLAAAGRERDLIGRGAEHLGDLAAGAVDDGAGLATTRVER
jgi:hypothetical protein